MDTNWINRRAYQLWEEAGKPSGHDLDFWLQAEQEYACHHICILNPGTCQYQETEATCGGKHISICKHPDKECGNRASDFLRGKYGPY